MPGTIANGRYRLVRQIGTGGMGTVHEAEDLHFRRRVAIKAIHRHFPEGAIERFRQEAFATAQLSHPHVVQVHDFIVGPPPYLVMEFTWSWSFSRALHDEQALHDEPLCGTRYRYVTLSQSWARPDEPLCGTRYRYVTLSQSSAIQPDTEARNIAALVSMGGGDDSATRTSWNDLHDYPPMHGAHVPAWCTT